MHYKNSNHARFNHYDDLFHSQSGLCAICRKSVNHKTSHIDHDHESGKIRGLLCINCNHLLGQAKDSVLILERAIEYLVKHYTCLTSLTSLET